MNKNSSPHSRDILTAIILLLCLVIAITGAIIVSRFVGTAVNIQGGVENIKLTITEVCAKNKSIISYNGGYPDYIELYNAGEELNLNGFILTDDPNLTVKYVFDDYIIKSGEYSVVFLDGTDIPFALSGAGGETLTLMAPDKTVCTQMTTVATESDTVMMLVDGEYVISSEPTPGFPNTADGKQTFENGVEDENPAIVISEVIVENDTVLPDASGNYYDIIEITNISGSAVSLKGYCLSDTPARKSRFSLPDITLESGQSAVVFASGMTYVQGGELHAPFGLSNGETVVLTSPQGKYVSVPVTFVGSDLSYSRGSDENGNMVYAAASPSPGFENSADGVEAFNASRAEENPAVVISELLLSNDETAVGGALCDVIELTNISDTEVSLLGYYLTDGGDPHKFALPNSTLAPGEILVLYADKQQGGVHVGFALSQSETLKLLNKQQKVSSAVSAQNAGRGLSWQRTIQDGQVTYTAAKPNIGFASDDYAGYYKATRPNGLEISEAVSVNTKYLAGPYATYNDFVELHNNSNAVISLAGYFLSDDGDEPRKAALPDITLGADEYYVIFLSTDGVNIRSGYESLPFSLSSSGETLYLSDSNGIVDCAVLPSLSANTPYGRASGSDGFTELAEATPGAVNSSAVLSAAEAPTSGTPQGVYNNVSALSVELFGKGNVYYTLDCSEPTPESTLYTSPLSLTKTTVVRARSYQTGMAAGKICDLIYVINEGHSLPVASLVTNPENLWDYYHGIYETGPGASSEFPYVGANYWQPWEKTATVSFFEADGSFSEPCGIRIFGAYSRALAMKSLSCFFRPEYGTSKLHYKLFDNSDLSTYDAFIFRNTGQDFGKARMRDPMIASLVSEYTTVDVQNFKPVVLYLNGEFWGVYYIREKINENYIAGNHNVDPSTVEIARASGTASVDYQSIITYCKSHNLANQADYDYIASKVDIENYIDYIVAEIIMTNTDNGNIRFYRTTGNDGKWRWIMFDVDQSFRTASYNTVSSHLNPAGTGSLNRFPTTLINALLKNPDFKERFLKRFAWQLNTIWNVETVNARIDLFEDRIEYDMQRDCIKWEKDYDRWRGQVQELRDFIKARHGYVKSFVKTYFSLSDSQMQSFGFAM